ncbi:MAG: hypothetical protein LC776_12025, partial [Acidobacteria bacterium]|nr:hypothetical protein [Acidobacteriota bacterium]
VFGIVRQTTQRGEAGFILPYLMPGEGYAQFINQNHFAFLMEMALGLVLGLVVGGGVRRDRVLIYLVAVVPVWTALVLSNSRGGIFSMLSPAYDGPFSPRSMLRGTCRTLRRRGP